MKKPYEKRKFGGPADMKSILQTVLNDRNLTASGNAASVLFFAKNFLQKKIPSEYYCEPKMWKNGVLRIEVENSVLAQKVYALSEDLLEHLREEFPSFRFKEVRTKIEMRGEL